MNKIIDLIFENKENNKILLEYQSEGYTIKDINGISNIR